MRRQKNPRRGTLEEESWRNRRRVLEGASGDLWISTQESSGSIWTSTQEASGSIWERPGIIWSTFWAERQSVLNLLHFSAKSDATDHFACTGARQHERTPQPSHKSRSPQTSNRRVRNRPVPDSPPEPLLGERWKQDNFLSPGSLETLETSPA